MSNTKLAGTQTNHRSASIKKLALLLSTRLLFNAGALCVVLIIDHPWLRINVAISTST